jgi:hypothetical protein
VPIVGCSGNFRFGSRAVVGGRGDECLRRADCGPTGLRSGKTGVHA